MNRQSPRSLHSERENKRIAEERAEARKAQELDRQVEAKRQAEEAQRAAEKRVADQKQAEYDEKMQATGRPNLKVEVLPNTQYHQEWTESCSEYYEGCKKMSGRHMEVQR